MSSLGDQRRAFSLALGILIVWANREGYAISIDDVKAHDGHKKDSFHYTGLAADLNLYFYVDDKWVYQRETEAHAIMGKEWKRLGGTWGGDFPNPDGNHYSWNE